MKRLLVTALLLFPLCLVWPLQALEDTLSIEDYRMMAKKARQNNEFEQSINLLDKALTKCKTNEDYKLIYNAIGSCYYKKTDYTTALAYFDSSYALLDLNKDSIFQAHLYNNYGIVYMQLEEYEKAIEYYKLASERIDKEAKGIFLYNLALCNDYMDRKETAIKYYKMSYTHNLRHFGEINYYTILAGIKLIKYGDLQIKQQLNNPVKELKNNYISSAYYYRIGNYEMAAKYTKDNNYFLLRIYAKTKQWYKAVSMIDTMRNSYNSVESKLFLQKNEMRIYKHAIDEAIQTDTALAFHYAQKSYGNILREMSGYQLSSSKSSYNYFDFDSVIYLFVIDHQKAVFHKIVADSAFWHQYQTFMHTLNPNFRDNYYANYRDFLKSGNFLYQRLLPQTRDDMLIIPNGRLQRLPFECLPTQMPEDTSTVDFKLVPYLLKTANVHYDYILRDYQNPRGRKSITALAPDTTLRYAVDEVKALRVFRSRRFLGAHAIKPKINSGDILHIASHFNLDSFSIRFADSTLLLKQLGKKYRDMVFLSTCLSGEGDYYAGEGIISPAREFYLSGAECVVESGWNTVDLSAYLIVRSFYKQLLLGRDKGEALRRAKLHFLRKTPAAYSHPYLWANFRVYGNNAPVKIALSPWGTCFLYFLGALLVFVVARGMKRGVMRHF